MKLGILTQPLRNNYGGLLQNYALQTVLKRNGHEVETLDWAMPIKTTFKGNVYKIARFILHYLTFGRIRKMKKIYVPSKSEDAIIHKHVYHFAKAYITSTTKTDDLDVFSERALAEHYDAFVVGSDQCWRPCYNGSFLPAIFLSFAKEESVKRVAYAASFGTDEWEHTGSMTALYADLAKRFDLITVRESSGIQLCKEHLGVNAFQVLDPTLLLDKEDYIKLIEAEKEPCSKGTLFHYILDPTEKKTEFINRVSTQLDLTPFMVLPKFKEEYRTKQNVKENIEDCVYPSVTAWLRAFMDAEMTIVDSFHGMVFSIIFNKPFWVIGNKTRGMSRFLSLLEQLNLKNRLLDVDELQNVDFKQSIDWDSVNYKRNELKRYSISLLLNALNNEKS